MPQGALQIVTTTASKALPEPDVYITVIDNTNQRVYNRTSDENGNIVPILIEAPDPAYSLDVNSDVVPYTTVDIIAIKEGFQEIETLGAQIFAGQIAIIEFDLTPIQQTQLPRLSNSVPVHQLLRRMPRSCATLITELSETTSLFALNYPIIPKYMTVHLGRPSASAENVTVTFKDYIKNVASSEIYPTWPEESLRANIYCQISLALNRIYTEWYPSQGYNFDITNSTAYDQYFVKGRNIFENISKIVDDIFNEYIRKVNTINPYYAEYCDGKQVTCKGLSQWGTVTLANQGLNAFEILKRYYGTSIELITTDRIEGVTGSYPGLPLKVGVRSNNVASLQNMLNRIAVNYPIIPTSYPVDGIFGESTRLSVVAFQKQFNLTQDGIVGKGTWYKVCYIFVAVKKLAELTAEGIEERFPLEYPGVAQRLGDRNIYVQEIQFMLQKISLFNDQVPYVKIDSSFGNTTRSAVVSFQRFAGLTADGVVGATTWAAMKALYQDTLNVDVPIQLSMPAYPGTPLRNGSTGPNVNIIQNALNTINNATGTLYTVLVDGIFGNGTEQAVRLFQTNNNLTVDGVVGQNTWNALRSQFAAVTNNPIAYSAINYELAQTLYQNYTSLIYDIDNEEQNI